MTAPAAQVKVVDPLQDGQWNRQLEACRDATIFHTSNWARLLAESYGYRPTYLALLREGALKGCLPVVEIDSVFTGKRGVSLSFSDYCGALAQEPADFKLLFDRLVELGNAQSWRYAEFRGEGFLCGETPARIYTHHLLELEPDEAALHSRLRESTARNIRKSVKEGVRVEITDALEGVREFYRLHCLTRKRHGLPPQPMRFFDKLHRHVIAEGLGFTAVAGQGGETLAAVICLHFGSHAVYKYGASDERFQQLRANNLVMWEAIRKCAREGYRFFSMGRTDLDNQGLWTFKNGWGGCSSKLAYHRYDFASSRFVADPEPDLERYRAIFRKLPVRVLRVLGALAYPHLG